MSAAGLLADLVSRLAAGSWAEAIAARLLWASLAGAVAVALAALAVRLTPRLPPALRAILWWLACLKLLLALLPLPPLALPLPAALAARLPLRAASAWRMPLPAALSSPSPRLALLSSSSRGSARRAGARLDRAVEPRRGARLTEEGTAGSAAARPALRPSALFHWRSAGVLALVALWVAGLVLGARDTARQLAAARRILRGARPAGSPALAARFAELSEQAGLARPPALLVSSEVASPVSIARAAGLGAPAVVLPAGWAFAEPELGIEMDMALCHELAHVRRGDLRWGWVPALTARLFFFHPLDRLAAREHALAREAACDAFVLARLAAPPAAYARLLLAIGATAAGRLHGAAALGAAPPPGTLKRRLLMLDATTRRPRLAWLALAGLAALPFFVPLHLTAQAAAAPAIAASSPAPAAAVAAAPVVATTPAGTAAPALAAAPAAAPVTIAMAAPAEVSGTKTIVHRGRKDARDEAYVLISKDGDVEMSGTTSDIGRARELAGGGSLLWFRRGGREYVVRDPALLAQVDELFAPQRELGKKQGALGARQGALGAHQGALGAKQGALGGRLASIALRGESADRERDDISRQIEDLGKQQEELGRQQEALGRQQEELGRQQEAASREAEAKLKPLLDDAIAHGVAQEVR